MTQNNSALQVEILILESEHSSDNSLILAVPGLPYNFKKMSSLEKLLNALKGGDFPLVLLNVENDCNNIVGTINRIRTNSPETQIIVLTNENSRTTTESVVDAGTECLFRPVSHNLLISKIKHACGIASAKRELMTLRQQIAMNFAFDNLLGVSPEIQKIKRVIQHSVHDHTAVILSGAEGTGKNLIARIIHHHSLQRHNPFVITDCSAANSETAFAEIFEKKSTKGTILIDKLHLANKAALLVLQKQIAQGWAGHNYEFRLIMTVNEPLYNIYARNIIDRKLVEGLNAIEISLPTLRERTEDIELLAAHFLRRITFENGTATPSISPGALAVLKNYSWPGNVRELENCLRQAVAECSNNCIDPSNLRLATNESAKFRVNATPGNSSQSLSLEENQRRLISDALDANEWNFTQTALQLGIGRTTLWRKVRKYNLKRGAEIANDPNQTVKVNQ